MLQALKESSQSRLPWRSASAFSVLVHSLVIIAAVVATLPPAGLPRDTLWNRVTYLPPPNRPQIAAGAHESVHYFTLSPGLGTGPGPISPDAGRSVRLIEHSTDAGENLSDSSTSAPPAAVAAQDSVYTTLEVDTAVVRSPSSASPSYPADLIEKRIEGSVVVRFIVDTSGFPDTASFAVVRSTHDGFVRALREALPRMQFSPAKIGPQKVKQLVEQAFSFKINLPAPLPPKKGRPL